MPHDAPATRRGFTLIELLLAIALMGILAALVLPNANPAVHDQLLAAAQIVATDLAYARSLAVTNDSVYGFKFELDENRYVLEHNGAKAELERLPKSPFHETTGNGKKQTVDLDELPRLGSAVRLLVVGTENDQGAVTERLKMIEFRELGETTESRNQVIWLTAGQAAMQRYINIQINPITGLATVGAYTAQVPRILAALPAQPVY